MATGQRRTQEQRRSEARYRLLLAAGELIAEGGMAAVTFVAVGQRAGYSRGMVSHHFENKAGLVDALVGQVEHEFVAATAPVRALTNAVDELVEMASIFIRLLDNPSVIHTSFLVMWAESVGNPDLRDRMRASDERFRWSVSSKVERGRARGDIDPSIDAAAFAARFIGTLRGVALQHLLSPEAIDLDRVRRDVERAIRSSLTP